MDEKGISGQFVITSEDNIDTLYPMFFGVSCAFFALKLLPDPKIGEDDDEKWSEIRTRMLRGSAHLLGLFIWGIQRTSKTDKFHLLRELENARKQVQELKKRRSEEAKANEKVVSIIASREQTWFDERRRLRSHMGALVKELRFLETKREKSVAELNEKLKETEAALQSKDKLIEEGEQKAKEAKNLVDELRANAKVEGERHSNEILKHKTAFIELVSNQRQLEAEMGRALRQVETLKQEIDMVSKQKEQSVLMAQRLSMEVIKTRKELEQKDQILSAMLRKDKLDEKPTFLKETKPAKVKRKQAEVGSAVRWKSFSEVKNERHSLRNMLSKRVNAKSEVFGKGLHSSMDASNFRDRDNRRGVSFLSDAYSTEGSDEQRLEKWVDAEGESETCRFAMEQRHNVEIDAFVEQLRLKDEKLEAIRWRLLSMELELKRLQTHVEGLDHEVTELQQENMKLEALVIDREAELHLLKEQLVSQFNPPNLQKLNFNSRDAVWSKVKVVKRKPVQKKQDMKAIPEEICTENTEKILPPNDIQEGQGQGQAQVQGSAHFRHESIESEEGVTGEASTSGVQGSTKKSSSTWKMDVHTLGVSYKIKRLKQQFLMLERLAGKQESCENGENNRGHLGVKGFYGLISLLNKQVDRYQSLQGKTDDICQRMHDNNLNLNSTVLARTVDETKKLENFLEETFQLQRYIVATGQKLMEVQTKIASGFVNNAGDDDNIEKPENFDMKRFADSIRTLFREVQRGLEVRISRIIGDLEGTLACDGIIHFKK